MTLLGVMFVVMAISATAVFFICRNARTRCDRLDDKVREDLEELARKRADYFGPNIYDIYRPR